MYKIRKNEWFIVAIISIIVVLLANLPLIIGYTSQGPNEVFMGVPVHVTDANNHLNLALQVKEGNILTANKFTAEEVPSLLFNPYHLIIGWTALIFGISVISSYIVWGILFGLIFFFTLHWFFAHFIKEKRTRIIALLLSAFSMGFAFWWSIFNNLFGKNFISADLWVTEINIFTSLGQPHFMFSLILFLHVIVFAWRAFEEKKTRFAFISGIFGLLLALTHIFDVITFTFILVAWFIVRILKNKKWKWKEFWYLVIIGAITGIGVGYYAWLFLFVPAYAEWNSLNQTITPSLIKVISGFGLIFFFSVYYIWRERKELFKEKIKSKYLPQIFFIIWIIINFLLIYLPFNVQRRFIMGLQIPMIILSAIVISKYIWPVMKKNWLKYCVVGIIIFFTAATTLFITSERITDLHSDFVGEFSNTKYLSVDEYNAMKWLDENTNNSDIVFAPKRISNYVPAVSGNKVYSGHWAQTIDYEKKNALVEKAYNEGLFPELFGVDYVWWFQNITIKEPSYSNPSVIIYEVDNE